MASLEKDQITTKCVELSKSLLNTGVGLFGYDLYTSRCIGNLARMAVSIRQTGEINRDQFAGISTALKIDYGLAENYILNKFQELDWVDLIKKGKKITRIDEKIPPTEDILSTLGKLWEEMEPSPIDQTTIEGLSRLSRSPHNKDALISELNTSSKIFETAFNYGNQASYFGTFKSKEDNEDIIWTPLYWLGKVNLVQRFLERQSYEQFDQINELTEAFISHPGLPRGRIQSPSQYSIVDAGISHGYFPSVGVKDRRGKQYEYLFAATPQFELDPKKDLFEKARLIVSCIRHGQYHAEITKIKYPRSILRHMRNSTLASHSYAGVQYFLLKCHGIVDLEKDGGRYKVKWIDTPENNLAGDIADQLLAGEEPIARTSEDLAIQQLLIHGTFNYSSEQRRIKSATQIAAIDEYDRLMEIVIGVRE